MSYTYLSFENWWWPYLFIFLAAALPTNIWRWVGVAFGGSIQEQSKLLNWVKAVATALIGGVIAQLILFPVGAFAEISLWIRLVAAALGVLAYLVSRKNILIGVGVAELVLIGLAISF